MTDHGWANMVLIKRITPEQVTNFRDVRLRALRDTPMAFGSTYIRESLLSDDDWQKRIAKWNSDQSVAYLAWDNEIACGITAGLIDERDDTHAHLLSMWISPTHRKRGIAKMLVQAVMDWARSLHVNTLHLMVTSSNDQAIGFYAHLGFVKTGRIEPYPNDSSLLEFEMIREIT